jgi:hypothetical protein
MQMNRRRTSRILLAENRGSRGQQLEFFAIVNLGLVQSLASRALTPAEAVRRFYHAANGLYVRRTLRSKEANEVMSRGTQLPDLFEILRAEEAQREFYQELEIIRGLCLRLLARGRSLHRLGNRAAA